MRTGYAVDDPVFADFLDLERPPERLAEGFTWTEGPVWMAEREALYFNDIPNKRMLRWREGDEVAVALANSEFANGNSLDREGRMISCEHGGRRVLRRLDPEDAEAVEVLASRYDGKRLNSPNDLVMARDGAVWFTDPPYGILSDVEGYQAESEIGANLVFRLDPDGTLTPVAEDFDKPNGLAFSPDEGLLYIADSGASPGGTQRPDPTRPHHIRVFEVADGGLVNARVFAEIEPGVPDGLRVDTEGCVWTSTGDGVHCYAPDGRRLGRIRLPEVTSNCCFGGPDGGDLFITATTGLYRVRTSRRGAA